MGVLKDLGTGTVSSVDPITGYPKDKWEHLLNPISPRDGSVVKDWDKAGTELVNFTNPYGHLHFCVGNSDDFYCFDYHTLNAGPRGIFMILDSTINSETGGFIQSGGYHVLPCNTMEDERNVIAQAIQMVDEAIEWCGENNVRVTKAGSNQEPMYFARSVAKCLNSWRFEKCSEREMRMGSKRVNQIFKLCQKD